jgi:hypothetical protein
MNQLVFYDHLHDILMSKWAFQDHLTVSELNKIEQDKAGHVIEVFPHFLHGEAGFKTDLAKQSFGFSS